jgi:cytochrome c oxidase subunit 2
MLLAAILVVLTLAGCSLFWLKPAWFPAAISGGALLYDRQFSWTLWICGIIFVVFQLLLAYAVFRRRIKPDPPATTASRATELIWTGAAFCVFIALALAGSRSWARIATPAPGKEVIELRAHQFQFSFRYSGLDGIFGRTNNKFVSDSGGNPFGIDPGDRHGRDDISTAALRIPAGRDVMLLMTSRDVIHDFFVRELRTKQDIVPGMEIPLDLHVDVPGQYEIACAELCGLGHSQMRSVLIVMPPAEYEAWKRGAQ